MSVSFMARQPIFDTHLRVYGYELLFRGGSQNFFQSVPDASSRLIADSVTLFDLQNLAGNARAFVNVDESALRLGSVHLLPPDRAVVEILETLDVSPETVAICRGLRDAGYLLALDDFVDQPRFAPLIELAHFLKVDFRLLDQEGREHIAAKYRRPGLCLLAEKVETEVELNEARRLGFSYFQGYFFCKPTMTEAQTIPANKAIYLELLNAVSPTDLDYAVIENLLKQEPALLYRLLRYLNSPLIALRGEIQSVREALALLGEQEFRRWVSIFAVIALAGGKPPELVRTALTRAYFCEELSAPVGMNEKKSSLFLMGLLSIADALLGKPIADVLRELPVLQEVKTALVGGENRLHDVYSLLLALERAEWQHVTFCLERLGCPEENVPSVYQSAIQKAQAISV
jgi:c-di-GMP-related signal transduction protein